MKANDEVAQETALESEEERFEVLDYRFTVEVPTHIRGGSTSSSCGSSCSSCGC
jgi:thiazolylpeptide-type bacteriocin precursor